MPADGEHAPRILHVATRFAGGGSEQRVRDIIEAIPDAEHRLVVGELRAEHRARCPVPPERVEVDPSLRRSVRPDADVRAVGRMIRRLRREPVSLVVTHQSKAGVVGRLAARRCGVPAVHSLSMASFGEGYGAISSGIFRTVERALVRSTSGYAVVGDDLAETYRALGVPGERLTTIRSAARLPLPVADRAAARRLLAARAGLPAAVPIIAHVGSLEPRKNVLDLAAVLALVHRLRAPASASMVVAGDGPLRTALTAAFRDADLDEAASVLGYVEDIESVFAGADLVVLLSAVEGLPQALVQATAAGIPFVSYDVSGVRELLAMGAAGTACRPGDLRAVARAAEAWLDAGVVQPRRVDLSSWHSEVIQQAWASLLAPHLEVQRAGAR